MRSQTARRGFGAALALGAALVLVAPTSTDAAGGGGGPGSSPIYRVNHTYPDNAGCSGPNFPAIQPAVTCAEQNGGGFTISVDPGTYHENLVLGAAGPDALTIVSTGGAAKTVIDGGGQGAAVVSGLFDAAFMCSIGECWQVTATIRGFTITNGSGYEMPGYVMDEYVGPVVVVGGGVLNGPGSSLTLANDIVTGNDVSSRTDANGDPYFGMGGGIFNDSFAKLTLSGTTVSDNTASAGGGVAAAPLWYQCPMHYCFSGDVHIQSKSAITGNRATEYGGGLMLTTHGSMTVSASTISHNVAGPATGQWTFPWPSATGGAIASVPSIWHDPYAPGGQTSLVNANLNHNSAEQGGGAIMNLGGQLTINGGRVADNAATQGPGGAILNIYEASASIGNATITGNVGTVGGGIANCQQATLNLFEGKIQSNTATIGGGGLDAEAASPWSAVDTAVRNNAPDQQNTTSCGITILLPPG